MRPSSSAALAASGAGLSTTVPPATSTRPTSATATASGEVDGVTTTVTPGGCAGGGPGSPRIPAIGASTCAARSPTGTPVSAAISRARSSDRSSRASWSLESASRRSSASVLQVVSS